MKLNSREIFHKNFISKFFWKNYFDFFFKSYIINIIHNKQADSSKKNNHVNDSGSSLQFILFAYRYDWWYFRASFSVCYDFLFLKKMAYVFLSVNCLIGLFSLHFCLFQNWLSFNTICCLICLQKLSKYFFIIGLYVQLLHQLFMFSISKLFTQVTGIFTVTFQAIFILPWTIGDR